ESPGAEHENCRGDHVREDDPDKLEKAGVKAALESRQRDDERARVDGGNQHPQACAGERPPLVSVMIGTNSDPSAAARRQWVTGRRGDRCRGRQRHRATSTGTGAALIAWPVTEPVPSRRWCRRPPWLRPRIRTVAPVSATTRSNSC